MKPSTHCSECGRPYPVELPVTVRVSGSVRQRLVNIIAGRPDGITRPELFDLLYGNSSNPPETLDVVTVHVKHANHELAKKGYWIRSAKGHDARYYLERMERGPSGQPPA